MQNLLIAHLVGIKQQILRFIHHRRRKEPQTLSHSRRQHPDQRNGSTGIDGSPDRETQEQRHTRIMLAEEDEHRLIEDMHIAETGFLRALSLIMQDIQRQKIVVITALQHTIGKVDILSIHEEILI